MKIDTKILRGLKQTKLNQDSSYDVAVNALLNSGFETDDNKFFEISAVVSGQAFKLQMDLDDKAGKVECTIVYGDDDSEVTKTYIDILEIPERFEDVSKKTIQNSLRKMGEGLSELAGLIMKS